MYAGLILFLPFPVWQLGSPHNVAGARGAQGEGRPLLLSPCERKRAREILAQVDRRHKPVGKRLTPAIK